MCDQAHNLPLPSGHPQINHLNNWRDHSYVLLADADPDVDAL